MKKVLLSALVAVAAAGSAFAANPFDELKDTLAGETHAVAQKHLDTFSRDLGGVIAGGAFHSGQTVGFPGIDVALRVPAARVADDNTIVKEAGVDTLFFPLLQVEVGLPGKFDLIGRFSSYSDATLVGGGLRYGVFKSVIPGLPSVSLQAMYNGLDVSAGENKLKASVFSASAMASFDIPVVDPYIGVGYDQTTVDPGSEIRDLSGQTLSGTGSGYRVEAGVNLGLLPFTYLQLGAALLNGELNYTAGIGARFCL